MTYDKGTVIREIMDEIDMTKWDLDKFLGDDTFTLENEKGETLDMEPELWKLIHDYYTARYDTAMKKLEGIE